MISSGDTFLDMREQQAQVFTALDNLFMCAEQPLPWVSILTRTHNRPKEFERMLQSVYEQDYEQIDHIVGSDVQCDYVEDYIKLTLPDMGYVPVPQGYYFCPWNTYFTQLYNEVDGGWIIALDDDDEFATRTAVSEIVKEIDNENQLLVWRVQITPDFIVPSHSFGQSIQPADISGIGYMFHSKHLPVDWGSISYGDYRVAKQFVEKGLEIKWIDKILTKTQAGARNGK